MDADASARGDEHVLVMERIGQLWQPQKASATADRSLRVSSCRGRLGPFWGEFLDKIVKAGLLLQDILSSPLGLARVTPLSLRIA